MATLSPVVNMVPGDVAFFPFFPECPSHCWIFFDLLSLLQWNAHIFHKEIVKLFVGRVCRASQLTDVVKSPYFLFDPLFW